MNGRRNALADIFVGLSPEKIEQLQRFVNTDSGFEEEPSSPSYDDVIDTNTTTNPTHTTSFPLNRYTDQSNAIDISTCRLPSLLSGIFNGNDKTASIYSAFRDSESSNDDTATDDDDDDDEDERFVQFVNSPRYLQRRFGIVENTFHENLNMFTGIMASH